MAQVARAEFPPRRFTVDEVYRMVEAGILDADEHVELLEGALYTMSPQGAGHSGLTVELRRRLEAAYGAEFHVRDHSPLRASDVDLPEPDLAVVRGIPRAYRDRLPTGGDVALVIEIATDRATRDRKKISIYARAGVPAYWIVELERGTIAVFEDPDAEQGSFRRAWVALEGDVVSPPGTALQWSVAELLE